MSHTSIPLLRDSQTALSQQLAEHWAERIRQRVALPGAKLPSVRQAAAEAAVNPSTVVAAYDRLVAQGLVEVRDKRGFYVREVSASRARGVPKAPHKGSSKAMGATLPHQSHHPATAVALIRGMYEVSWHRAPGLGVLPPPWFDHAMLQKAMRQVVNQCGPDDPSALHHGQPAGDAVLREALALRLEEVGVSASPQQILTTAGATHALDLITRSVLRAGDAVMVDDPGWSVEYARLTRAGMRVLPVPRHADGPDLAAMRAHCGAHRPRAYVTVSVLHNPSGASYSAAAAHAVLQLAEAFDFLVVEDDTYAHFAPAHLPRLAALDGLKRTLYVGGFSKMLAPAWRVGFVAGPQPWIEALTEQKMLTTLTTNPWTERALAHCLQQGQLRRHAERVNERLATARARVTRLAEDAGARFVHPPRGMFGWLDVGFDTEAFALSAHQAGWFTAPGLLFSPVRQAGSLMRVNVATSQDPAFWALVKARPRSA